MIIAWMTAAASIRRLWYFCRVFSKLMRHAEDPMAIARAMLADPRILILDEATSDLDTESERYIQASLGELMRDRTSFVIAHRLSTITDSDRIVLLEAGRIVDQGPHSELLQQSETYRQMVFMQFQGDAGDSNGEEFVSISESDVL